MNRADVHTPEHVTFLRNLVRWRNETKELLFSLYELVMEHNVKSDPKLSAAFQLCVGATFSL
jgi:hypothetical protein